MRSGSKNEVIDRGVGVGVFCIFLSSKASQFQVNLSSCRSTVDFLFDVAYIFSRSLRTVECVGEICDAAGLHQDGALVFSSGAEVRCSVIENAT